MTVIAERLSCASVDEVGALLPVVGGTTTVPLVDGTQRVYANLDYAASAPALEAVAARVTRGAAAVRLGAPRRRLPVAGVDGPVRVGPPDRRARSSTPVPTTSRSSRATPRTRSTCSPGVVPDGRPRARAGRRAPRQPAALGPVERAPRQPHDDPADRAARSPRRLDALRAELARQPYALVTITGASNVTGEALPIDEVVALAHAEGARVAVDGAQLVPHRGFSLAATGRRLRRVLRPQDVRTVRRGGARRPPRLARHGHAVPRRGRCGARRARRPDRLAAGPGAPRGRVAQRHRRDRARGGVRPARRPAGRCAGRARGGAARAAGRRSVGRSTASRSRASGRTRRRPSAC